MIINDTSLLTDETKKKLNETGLVHVNNGGKPITEEQALGFIEMFSREKMAKYLEKRGVDTSGKKKC